LLCFSFLYICFLYFRYFTLRLIFGEAYAVYGYIASYTPFSFLLPQGVVGMPLPVSIFVVVSQGVHSFSSPKFAGKPDTLLSLMAWHNILADALSRMLPALL
jgi:hypothetical protein